MIADLDFAMIDYRKKMMDAAVITAAPNGSASGSTGGLPGMSMISPPSRWPMPSGSSSSSNQPDQLKESDMTTQSAHDRPILAGATHGAIAQTPKPQTPTTKILAVGTFAPGTDMSQVQRILPTEVRETAHLYLDGKIDQWYSLEDRPGVVFILNVTDIQAAHAMLEELPLGRAHLMTFQLMPIGPLNPLRQLLVPPASR